MTDQDKPSIMETIMRDQERRFVMNNIAKPATGETPDGKPRICEVLGVEVEERFNIVGCSDFDSCDYDKNQRFFIDSTGTLLEEMTLGCDSPAAVADGRVVCLVWNHPDRIIRKPRFTEEEVANARAIRRMLPDGEVEFMRDMDGRCRLVQIQGCLHGCLSLGKVELFPSVRPGQSISLEDIVGGDA